MNNDKGRLGIIDLQSRFHRKVFLEERVEQVKNEILKIEEIEQVRRAELAEKMKEQKIIELEKNIEDLRTENDYLRSEEERRIREKRNEKKDEDSTFMYS